MMLERVQGPLSEISQKNIFKIQFNCSEESF